MLRLLSRFLGYWLVAAAVVLTVVDGAKSIAASTLVTTPVSETWAMLAALGETGDAAGGELAVPWPADAALAWLLAAPTAAIAAVLGFLFLVAGRRRRRALFGREYAT